MSLPSMATSPSPFFFPTSATAYAPTTVFSSPPPGFGAPAYGHYPSPFPYTFSSYLAPAPGFFPAPTYGSPATYHHPPPASAYTPASAFSPNWPPLTSDPASTQIGPHRPPPAPPQNQDDPHQSIRFPYSQAHAPQPEPTSPATAQPWVASAPSSALEPRPQQNGDLSSTRDITEALSRLPLDGLLTDIFDHAPETPSFGITPSGSTMMAVSAPSTLPNTGAAASSPDTAYAAPQVFGEMPAPRPGYENCCSGHPNPIQSSRVQGGSINLSEQNLDGVPECYGLHSLERHSLFRADGTEHNYFTLPEDYPLRQATQPMSALTAENVGGMAPLFVAAQAAGLAPVPCSKANNTVGYDSLSVGIPQLSTTAQDTSNVGKEIPVYDIYEEDNSCLHGIDEQLAKRLHKSSENSFCEQLFKCFSKAMESEQTSACLYYITDVSDPALEQQQHDEKASENVQQLRGSQLNVLVTHERRKEWDLGVDCFGQPVDLTQFSLHPTVNIIEVDTEEVEVKVERPIKLTNDKSTQAAFILSIHEAIVHFHGERYELNIKKQDVIISKATDLKQTSACLHATSDVQVFSRELQQQDDERAYNCSDLMASDSVVTGSRQLSIYHSMRELRLLCDP